MAIGYNELAGKKKEDENKSEIKSKVTDDMYIKPSFFQKLKKTLVPNDPRDVARKYFWERWMPGVLDLVCDAMVDMVYGVFNDMSDGRIGSSSRRRKRKYNRSSLDDSSVGRESSESEGTMGWREWNHIPPFKNKYDAEEVLIDVRQHLERYDGKMSMREWFQFHNKDTDFTTCRFGWKDLDPDDVEVIPYGGGWKLDIPKPEVL